MVLERRGKTLNVHNYLTIHCDKGLKEEKQEAMIEYNKMITWIFLDMRFLRPEIFKWSSMELYRSMRVILSVV